MIEVTRVSADELTRTRWVFDTSAPSGQGVLIRWVEYAVDVRKSKRHKFDARGAEPLVQPAPRG